jgi:phosphate transport system protein
MDFNEFLALSNIVTDLERVADEARKIARLTINFYGDIQNAPDTQMFRDLMSMVDYVDTMLNKSIQAFDVLDLDIAFEVIRLDVDLEASFKTATRNLSLLILENPDSVEHTVDTVLGLRAMERVGGHAKNIAGYVVSLVKGIDVQHGNLDAVAGEVLANAL